MRAVSGQAFLDETKQHGLLVVVVVLDDTRAARARRLMRGLCLPGQSRVHFTKESDPRRRAITDTIAATGATATAYDATALADPRAARAACLRAAVADLAATDITRLVLERDDSLFQADQALLYRAIRDTGQHDRLGYEHLPARSEPLLWIPDAIAWCATHDRPWQTRIRDVLTRTEHLPPTGRREHRGP